jgi:arabinofuranosyltransferase
VLAFAVTGVSVLVTVASPNVLDRVRERGAQTSQLAEIGSWLGANLQPGTVVSTYDNGALSYRAGTQLQIVDDLGVTDEHIARQGKRADKPGPTGGIATDYDYVVNVRRPAVAVTGTGYAGNQHCAIDPVYAGRYRVATYRRAGTRDWIALYLRSEQAATLIADLDKDSRFVYVACPA